jgi:hypothetical protein
MPVIPPLWRRRQEDQELKDSLGYISRPYLSFCFSSFSGSTGIGTHGLNLLGSSSTT